jgi:hypothetical protein
MKDGTKIRICDMSDRHLLNTIKMLERNHERHVQEHIREGYNCLAGMSGEIAVQSIEDDLDLLERGEVEPGEFVPIYDDMVGEAARRGLNLESPEVGPAIGPREFKKLSLGAAYDAGNFYKN